MNLIEELYALQSEHGYLREADLRALSQRTKVPLYEIEGVSSFYPHFRRTKPPRLHVACCRDLSCRMADPDAIERMREACVGPNGPEGPDGPNGPEGPNDVEFHASSCLGRCDMAPAATVNDVPVRAGSLPDVLPADEPTTTPRRWRCDTGRYQLLADARQETADLDEMIQRIKGSGLRGMGGAGFPTGFKWELVRKEAATPKYVVCNADESEPGTFKDRVILEELPHLVIEGMALAALAIGANQGWIYIRHEYVRERKAIARELARAKDEGVLDGFDLRIFVSPGGYILGEETALLEALEGKRGEPRNKPPYPGQKGLWGQPTLINNVESLALIPHILRTGKSDLKFFSVSGDVEHPGVHEVDVGTTLGELIDLCGGMRNAQKLQAFLPGGASTGFLRAEHADIVMDWKPLQEAGSALGSGAVVIVDESRDLMELAQNLTEFFRNESCGKCVPCRIGTEKAVVMIENRDQLDRIGELHETLLETSICGLGQAALIPILSVLRKRP